jgi:pilus assembly protein CpaE
VQRTALIVAGAAGPHDIAASVLQRYGFAPAQVAHGLNDALTQLRAEHVDLLILPLAGIDVADMAALERELRQQRGTLVIGTAAEAASDVILRAMRAGIHEFLVYPPDPKDLSAAVDRLTRRARGDAKLGAVIAVYSGKGGLGTTSVAVNLAFALAKQHPDGRIALADFVGAGGDVRVMLNLRPAYDIGDLVKKLDRIDADLLHSLLSPVSESVWVLPSSEDPEVTETLDAAAAGTILDQLRAHYAFTVVDCDHHVSDPTLAALDAATRIVLVTQLNVQALRSTQRTLGLCRRLGFPDEKVVVVVNLHQSGDVVSAADAVQVLERSIFFRLPNDYKASTAAMTKGVPIAQHDPRSPLAASFEQLASRLNGTEPAAGRQSNGQRTAGLARLFSLRRKP